MKTSLPLLLLFALGSCSQKDAATKPLDYGVHRPVILISIDSLRADHTTPYGYRPEFAPTEATMPFLAQMAKEGTLFENTSSACSWTLPSHMSLLTAMNPVEHGVRSRKWSLGKKVPMVSNVFQDAGYHTAGFFSAPFLHPVWGFHQGFEVYMPGPDYLGTLEAAEALGANRKSETVDQLESKSHTDTRTAEQTIDRALLWLKKDQNYEQPFFLFLHLWDPHYDYFPPQEYRERFLPNDDGSVVGDELMQKDRELTAEELAQLKALYDAEIRYTDDQIARLWQQLESWGIADQVVIAITSDHGEEFMEHGRRGHHHTLYEEVMHVPMVLRAPGLVPADARIQATVSNMDLAPTLLDLCQLKVWGGRSGHSLRPLWEEKDIDRALSMDLLRPALDMELRGYRHGHAKGIFSVGEGVFQVFDLEQDPEEQHPRLSNLQNKEDAFAAETLNFLLKSQAKRHRPAKVTESPAMTSLLSELGYTED